MKDITKKELPQKGIPIYNRYVQFIGRKWVETTPTGLLFESEGATFFRPTGPFGILKSSDKNIHRAPIQGKAGDYLIEQSNGGYKIVEKAKYKAMYPDVQKKPVPFKATNSRSLL